MGPLRSSMQHLAPESAGPQGARCRVADLMALAALHAGTGLPSIGSPIVAATPDLLQCHQLACHAIPCLVHHAICALSNFADTLILRRVGKRREVTECIDMGQPASHCLSRMSVLDQCDSLLPSAQHTSGQHSLGLTTHPLHCHGPGVWPTAALADCCSTSTRSVGLSRLIRLLWAYQDRGTGWERADCGVGAYRPPVASDSRQRDACDMFASD